MDVIVQAPVDLTFCDLEPIHIPGSIQPHGVMLVVDPDGLQVRYTAGDVESKLGMTEWQNLPLSAFIGPALSAKVAALKKLETEGSFIGQFESSTGTLLDVSAQISDAHIIVELETMSEEEVPVSLVLDRLAVAAAGFGRAASIASLCDRAAVEFRRLTGFDRVMVYRFIKDGAGKVLAESKRDELTGFLNHHFPASDIPQQARALYIRNPIRVISDVEYEPALLQPNWAEALPLDMGDCNFRSVSPFHLQYLRNMGVGASASISIVKDGALWGLVACHNKTPRDLTHDVRAACVSLAGSLALQIKVKDEANGYRERIRLHGFQAPIA